MQTIAIVNQKGGYGFNACQHRAVRFGGFSGEHHEPRNCNAHLFKRGKAELRLHINRRFPFPLNALTAADKVIIPVQSHYLPVKGLEQLLKTVSKVQRQINSNLQISGILITMVEGRSNFLKEIGQLVRQAYGRSVHVYDTEIPRGIKAAEMSAEGKSIYAFDPKSKVAVAYEQFTKEVLQNEKQREKHSDCQL